MPEPSSASPSDAVARWADRLARFNSQSLSVVAFCAAEGIATSKFYHWKRRLTRTATPAPPATPAVVPLRVTPPPAPVPAPVPFELVLPSGALLRFPPGTPAERIVAILRGLEGRPC